MRRLRTYVALALIGVFLLIPFKWADNFMTGIATWLDEDGEG